VDSRRVFQRLSQRFNDFDSLRILFPSDFIGIRLFSKKRGGGYPPPLPLDMNVQQALNAAIKSHRTGNLKQAEAAYLEILSMHPNHPDVHHLLGVLAYQSGNYEKAISLIDKAIRANPNNPEYHSNLGAVFKAQGSYERAFESYARSLELNPRNADTHYNVGNCFRSQGSLKQAATSYQKALDIDPSHINAWYNLGHSLQEQGEFAKAINFFQEVLSRNSLHSASHNAMGHSFKVLGELDKALSCFRKALEANPKNVEAVINVGSIFQDMMNFEAARESYIRALQLGIHYAAPYMGLAFVMLSLGELSEIEGLKKTILGKLDIFLKHDSSRWTDVLIYLCPLLSIDEKVRNRLTDKMDLELCRDKNERGRCKVGDAGKPLKVGYVSPDFGDHPISHVLKGVFAHHERSSFEIFAYSLKDRSNESSDYYREIVRSCDHFVDLSKYSDDEAVNRIESDGIAILVDLTGYMKNARLEIFARRPAPIQIYWLGHGGGLGLSFMDYVIADNTVIPPGMEGLYRENIIYMPEVYHPADTPPVHEGPVERRDYGLPETATVFCVFNNPQKINREVFESWMNILSSVPESVLWISNPGKSTGLVQNLRKAAEKCGINPFRLVFAERISDKSKHFARHRLADLFLDTFTYNASTTALDALWAGLPILTRSGKTFYSRICASMLTHVGLSEMICHTTREYEDQAVFLATNRDVLQSIKKRLRQDKKEKPLFDTPRFVKHLERAYRTAWTFHTSGQPPQAFSVPAFD